VRLWCRPVGAVAIGKAGFGLRYLYAALAPQYADVSWILLSCSRSLHAIIVVQHDFFACCRAYGVRSRLR